MIVQSNDDIYNLRLNLLNRSYKIIDEKIVYEKKYYIIMKCIRGITKYNHMQLKYGPLLLEEKSKEFVNYLNDRKRYLEDLLNKIPNKFILRKIKVLKEINRIKAILK